MPAHHVDRAFVYCAAPYQFPDPVENTHRTVKVADRLDSTGIITAYVPHISLLWHLIVPHDADFWYSYDLAVLNRADALLRLPGVSVGADNEVQFAEDHNIEVFWEIDDLIAWAESFMAS